MSALDVATLKGWVLAECGGWRGPQPGVRVLDLEGGAELLEWLASLFAHNSRRKLNGLFVALTTLIKYANDIGDRADAARLREVRNVVELAIIRRGIVSFARAS